METNEILFSKGGEGKSSNGKSSEGFIDRSKVRILLCDNDAKSSEEVFTLLCKCSYQVTSVRSPRQVVGALNAEGPDIDIILSEVDLPMAKGLKLLKYIMRDKDLLRIPVIMMSAQDEVSLVVKCLRLGAADYLVKPLRMNELLNLWTHMWRRRRLLGLAEKNIMTYDFDLMASDPSDANANSTTLFSDDTDDKSRRSVNPDACVSSTHKADETHITIDAGPVEAQPVDLSGHQPEPPGINDPQRGQITSGPKKSELKIGQASAFFTYVKSNILRSNTQLVPARVNENAPQLLPIIEKKLSSANRGVDSAEGEAPHHVLIENKSPWDGQFVNDYHGHVNSLQSLENPSKGGTIPHSFPVDRSHSSFLPLEYSQQRNSNTEELCNSHHDISGYHPHSGYSYYVSGVMNQVMMSSSPSMCHINDFHNRALPHYNHVTQCPPHFPGMPTLPYYPVSVCLQPGQMPTMQQWPSSYGSSSLNDGKLSKVDRREAALLKFRQKRKERCFDKKIRYVNRKRLAERRPRVRGQFVRKMSGIDVDLNGQPSTDFDYEDKDDGEEEDQADRDSSPDDDSSLLQG